MQLLVLQMNVINDAVSMPGLQNETEQLEGFVQGNCYVVYRTHLHTHTHTRTRTHLHTYTHRNVTCCYSFFLELQTKLKAGDDTIRASES